ncbi:M90 family metallopeptidase [Rapidithrix thailandica]|uniref:M90 family metallopeptidase n=1 Tax=Rapidithrix thailandica TaxID=413964 RepID=A0AAW9RZZ9_9BACT
MTEGLIVLTVAIFLFFCWKWVFASKKETLSVLTPTPEEWKQILQEEVAFYQQLSQKNKKQFENDVMEFLHDVQVVGVDTEVEDLDLMLVASSAVIPMFAFPKWKYRDLKEVLLYSNSFNRNFETDGDERTIAGMVGNGYMRNSLLLSKRSLREGFRNKTSKNNVGIHEFIHLIDREDGSVDGIPEILLQHQYVLPWVEHIRQGITAIVASESDINPYGATNTAEFFSVASEYFFKRPKLFRKKHPELYRLMKLAFQQNPAVQTHQSKSA